MADTLNNFLRNLFLVLFAGTVRIGDQVATAKGLSSGATLFFTPEPGKSS